MGGSMLFEGCSMLLLIMEEGDESDRNSEGNWEKLRRSYHILELLVKDNCIIYILFVNSNKNYLEFTGIRLFKILKRLCGKLICVYN